MVKKGIRMFTEEEEKIIRNFNQAKKLNMTTGLNERYGTFEDVLVVNNEGVSVDRNFYTDDGGFIDVEEITEDYLDMVFMNGIYIGEVHK